MVYTTEAVNGTNSPYTVEGTLTGTPSNLTVTASASATYKSFNNGVQLTGNNSFTLRISGMSSDYRLKGITLQFHSNKDNGTGTMTAKLGNTSVADNLSIPKRADGTDGRVSRSLSMSNVQELLFDGQTLTITVLATSNSLYVENVTITYEEGSTPTCATPPFSPAAGTYSEAQNVTISCATSGATIRYTVDGTDPTATTGTVYTSPISVTSTTTIKAIATATGYDPSSVATATYTINLPQEVSTVAEIVALADKTPFTFTGNLVVSGQATYNNNKYLYAQDATGGMLFFKANQDYVFGDLIPSGFTGTKTTYNGAPEVTNINMEAATIHDQQLTAEEITPNGIIADADGYNVFEYSVIKGATITLESGKYYINVGDKKVLIYDRFGHEVPSEYEDKVYDVYGVSGWYNGAQFMPLDYVEKVITKYAVTCADATNGEISTDKEEYAEGETVTVTVTPNPGYELATLVYNDGVDHDIKDAKSFNMPASNVTVTATFSKVGDLYVMGNVNGIDVNGWHANQGVKMDFINGAYTADIWVTGKWNDEMQKNAGSFAFTKVLANNGSGEGAWGWVNGYGHRIQPNANGKYYWLNSGSVSNIPLYVRGDNDGEKEFLIPAGLYTITVTPADPSVQNDTWKFSLVEKNLTPTITPNGGDVALNSTATVALSEDFNEFIANCPKVLECTPGNGSDVYTELSLTLPEVKLVLNGNVAEGTTTDYEFATAGSVTLTSEGKLMFSGSEITSATKTATATFNVTEVDMSNVYTLVKSATDLVAGGEYLIVSSKGDDTYNVLIGEIGGTTAKPYATAIIEASIYDATRECITLPEGCLATPLTLGYDETTQKYTFYNGSGYLNSPEDDNYLNTSSSISNTSQWIIDTNEFPASNKLIQNSERTTRYIAFNASSPRFACYAGTQQPVALFKKGSATPSNKTATPVITPDSKDVKGGLLEGITITAGEEGTTPVIYYTTDGSDPGEASNANRVQYTVPFNIQVTQGGPQTVKAIAIENGKDPSNVVSVQYMFKNPDAPTFTPDPAVVQTGDFTITINSADGGVIYYVLDPDANEFPSNSEEAIATGQVYADGVAVSGTGEHKIYAAVVLNGLKSTLSTATYTVIETGAEGDWQLVTSVDQITDGYDYIIVNSDHDRAIKSGDLETSRFYSVKCENNVVFGPNFATATVAGSDVRIFGFETEGDNIYMKDADNSRYYNFTSDVSTGKQPVYITMADGFVYIKGAAEATKSLAYNTANGNYFGIYATPTTTTGSQRPIYLYRRGVQQTPIMTLADICKYGVTTEGKNEYIIADKLQAVYAYTKGGNSLLWCKDLGNKSIVPTTIHSGQIDFMREPGINYDTEEGVHNGQQGPWDQSNWIVLQFTNPTGSNNIDQMLQAAQDKFIKPGTIKGKLVDNENYILKMDLDQLDLVTQADPDNDEEPYNENVYCPANFLPENLNIHDGIENGDGAQIGNVNYFFMNPKVQEICEITYAQWDDYGYFAVPSSSDFSSGIDGAFQVGWVYQEKPALVSGKIYKFHAVVHRVGKGYGPQNPVSTKDGMPVYENITVLPIDLTGDDNIVTSINTVETGNGEVKSVKYVNVAGMVSDVPFQGVNIVVTEYSDGSRSTSKMLRK